jgi:hypothetical protein
LGQASIGFGACAPGQLSAEGRSRRLLVSAITKTKIRWQTTFFLPQNIIDVSGANQILIPRKGELEMDQLENDNLDLPVNDNKESFAVTAGTPGKAARVRRFKLKLSLPGKNLPGEWLCRKSGSALAYQDYCAPGGAPSIFTWYHDSNGKAYLQDQEGNWLSYRSNCLYMSYWNNAVAWKLQGKRLIRESDGAVVKWKKDQVWPAASDYFLLVSEGNSPTDGWEPLTVELVELEMTPVEKLLEKMTPVFCKRHKSSEAEHLDRYLFTVRSAPDTEKPADRMPYEGHDVAFFGLNQPDDATVPVYVLRMKSSADNRVYYKLSLKTEEAGYTLETPNSKENFHAFISSKDQPYLAQVYEHSAQNPTGGKARYYYDFDPNAHDGWGAGVPIFRAITKRVAERALSESLGAESARNYASEWAKTYGDKLGELLQGLRKEDVDRDVIEKLHTHFEGMPEPRYMSLGAGVHGGFGFGTAGVEFGSFWFAKDFGQVPMHEPISDYSVEWVTFGAATGFDLGASADAVVIGTWFGDISQIEGACNGVTLSLTVGGGITVTLLWDGTWSGANYSPHPIGVTAIASIGVEIGGGVYYNASATQFWKRRPNFPKM